MSDRKVLISEEELLNLSNKVGTDKFLKRQKEFLYWINSFIEPAKAKGSLPAGYRFIQDMNVQEIALYLNFFYWQWIESYVKKVLIDSSNGDVRVNNYKIAATIEFVVMKYLPFEDSNGEPLMELNADLAFHIALQFLFAWNLEQDNISVTVIKELLTNNKPTKEFLDEHKKWLRYHASGNQIVIFSNMQTMRLLHYWFRDPKDDTFQAH